MNVTGKIKDAATGELLEFANAYVSDAAGKHVPQAGATIAAADGSYTLQANAGQYITASIVGYKPLTLQVTGATLNFLLASAVSQIDEVEVSAPKAFPIVQLAWGLAALVGLGYIIYEYKTSPHANEFPSVFSLGIMAYFSRGIYDCQAEFYGRPGWWYLCHYGTCISFYAGFAGSSGRQMDKCGKTFGNMPYNWRISAVLGFNSNRSGSYVLDNAAERDGIYAHDCP